MVQVRGKEKVKASTHPENNRNQSELEICISFPSKRTEDSKSHMQLCPLNF